LAWPMDPWAKRAAASSKGEAACGGGGVGFPGVCPRAAVQCANAVTSKREKIRCTIFRAAGEWRGNRERIEPILLHAPARSVIVGIAKVNVAFVAPAEPFCVVVEDEEGLAESLWPWRRCEAERKDEPG